MPNKQEKTRADANRRAAALGCAYVALVLLVDLLAASGLSWPFAWSGLRWMLGDLVEGLNGGIFDRFDLFKFVFWLLVPLSLCWKRMDWRYLVRARWTKWDALFVGGDSFGKGPAKRRFKCET